MKKIIVVFALLLSLSAIAQIFPEKRPELLQDQLIKVNTTYYNDGYGNFMTKDVGFDTYAPTKGDKRKSEKDSLAGRIFKVVGITRGEKYRTNYSLKLEDTLNKKNVYYRHSTEGHDSGQLKMVSSINYPADFYSDYLTEIKGPYKGEVYFKSKKTGNISVNKIVKNNVVTYSLILEARSDYDSKLKKGAVVVLENKKKIVKPNVIVETKLDYPFYTFATGIILTKEDLGLLMSNKIVSYTLLDDDKADVYGSEEAEILKGVLRYMITK